MYLISNQSTLFPHKSATSHNTLGILTEIKGKLRLLCGDCGMKEPNCHFLLC